MTFSKDKIFKKNLFKIFEEAMGEGGGQTHPFGIHCQRGKPRSFEK